LVTADSSKFSLAPHPARRNHRLPTPVASPSPTHQNTIADISGFGNKALGLSVADDMPGLGSARPVPQSEPFWEGLDAPEGSRRGCAHGEVFDASSPVGIGGTQSRRGGRVARGASGRSAAGRAVRCEEMRKTPLKSARPRNPVDGMAKPPACPPPTRQNKSRRKRTCDVLTRGRDRGRICGPHRDGLIKPLI
jgi:hypothetical protein